MTGEILRIPKLLLNYLITYLISVFEVIKISKARGRCGRIGKAPEFDTESVVFKSHKKKHEKFS